MDDIWQFFSPYDEIIMWKRKLPHWQQYNVWHFVTFRLYDSLPEKIIKELNQKRMKWMSEHKNFLNLSDEEKREYYLLFSKRIEQLLDNGFGRCFLKDKNIAEIVAKALIYFNNKRYELDEWIIMPNHIHLLVKPYEGYKLSSILHSWKSYTANQINLKLNRTGPLWMREYYDHIVRHELAFEAIRNYIKKNPEYGNTIGYGPKDFK